MDPTQPRNRKPRQHDLLGYRRHHHKGEPQQRQRADFAGGAVGVDLERRNDVAAER